MPISFSSPPRNLFLLGSSGADVVTNFFRTIDRSAGTDGVYIPDEIKFNYTDEKFLLAGSAQDSVDKQFGWFEKRTQDGSYDWDVRVEATTSVNTTLRAMELDSSDNLIVVGKTGSVPWIAKYSNGGVIEWSSTTNSGDVEYTGVTSDSSGQYYACGSTPVSGQAQAFVEKFDASGNPGWGKSAFMLGRDVVLNKVAANSRGEVVAVGYLEDDSKNKGYIVKIDTNTGEVLWDRTITDPADYGLFIPNTQLTDVYIDSIDQIYVVGFTEVNSTRQFVIKYTAEGNIVWQKQSSNSVEGSGADIVPVGVKSDGETEQTIVAASYTAFGFAGILLSKYGKAGDLVWRRMISTDFEPSQLHSIGIDADPSFYYFLYSDETINVGNGTPDQYTFGKVSSSGNGLGAFQYQDGTGTTIDYEISAIQDELGRLSDGSVRNDSSDLITYPFSPNKLLFDDLATQVSNKKRQMDTADSFEYSGSPAIRPADFPIFHIDSEKNGDQFEESKEFVPITTISNPFPTDITDVAMGNGKIVVSTSSANSVFVYNDDGTNQIEITPSVDTFNTFGDPYVLDGNKPIDINHNKIAIGATDAELTGAVFLYDLDGSNEIIITPSDGISGARKFGTNVVLRNNKVYVTTSAAFYPDLIPAIYIYDLDGSNEIKINFDTRTAGFGAGFLVTNYNIYVAGGDGFIYRYNLDGTNKTQITPAVGDGYGPMAMGISSVTFWQSSNNSFIHKTATGTYGSALNIKNIGGSSGINPLLIDNYGTTRYENLVVATNRNSFRSTILVFEKLPSSTTLRELSYAGKIDLDAQINSLSCDTEKFAVGTTNEVLVYTNLPNKSSFKDISKYNHSIVSYGTTINDDGYWQFDGNDDYLDLGTQTIDSDLNMSSPSGGGMTVEWWGYYNGTGDSFQRIIDRSNGGGSLNGWAIYTGAVGSTTDIRLTVNGEITVLTSSEQLVANVWQHWIFTWDQSSGNWAWYLNGEPAGSGNATWNIPAVETGMRIGTWNHSTGREYNGSIGEMRIYPRALTSAQAFQNYNATKPEYINKAPIISPKISNKNIVYDNSLLLNYDFGNKACFDGSDKSIVLSKYKWDQVKTNIGDNVVRIPFGVQIILDSFGHTYNTSFNPSIRKDQKLALTETKIVVGADFCRDDNDILPDFGAIFTFDHDGTNPNMIISSNPSVIPRVNGFGRNVKAKYGKIFTTSINPDDIGLLLHIFNEDGSGETSIPLQTNDNFYDVSMDVNDNKIVVGLHRANGNVFLSGKLAVYDLDGLNLIDIDPNLNETIVNTGGIFGYSVAIGDERIVASSPKDNISDNGFVFLYNSNELGNPQNGLIKIIENPEPEIYEHFGFTVSVGSGIVAITAVLKPTFSTDNPPSVVYIYDLNGNYLFRIDDPLGYIFKTKEITNPNSIPGYLFGYKIEIENNKIYISSPYAPHDEIYGLLEEADSLSRYGALYIYDTKGNYLKKISFFNSFNDTFGTNLAVNNGKILSVKEEPARSLVMLFETETLSSNTEVKNLSSSSYTGTINGATFNSAGYFEFDGTDDDIETGLSWTPANTFSFTMWFNLDTIKEWHNLVDLFADTTNRNFQLFVEGDGDFRIFWGNSTTGSHAITSPTTVANTWYFGAFTSDGENGTLYRYGNGTTDSVSATAAGFVTYSVKPLVLGRRGDSPANGFVDGKIGEFQFYNRELTAAEILKNYNATRGKYGV